MNFPIQLPCQDIFEFYHVFLDVIGLCAIFMGGTDDTKSAHMIDCFIQSCHQSKYLTQISRFDRKDPLKKHSFESGNLAITLTNYLASADSLIHSAPPAPIPPTAPAPYRNTLASAPYCNTPGAPHRNPDNRHVREMISKTLPSTLTPAEYDQHYEAVIHELRAHDPTEAPICALCKTESHRFKECPFLNDDTFLCGFAIRMCSTVSKELHSGKYRLANPTDSRIHAMLQDTVPAPPAAPSPLFPPGGI
jgi:hypothetical protein